ncbi:MAG: right-handed parallel beta-helix repeat-containing protein [Pseudomonadota bacterium]
MRTLWPVHSDPGNHARLWGAHYPGLPNQPRHVGVGIASSGVTVQNCVLDTFQFGIGLPLLGRNATLQGNTLENNFKGIWFGPGGRNSTITGNHFNTNGEFGLEFRERARNNTVKSNTAFNNGRVGIQINRDARVNVISHNYVFTADDEDLGTRGGIALDSDSVDNVIEHNTVDGGIFGIRFNGGVRRNLIRENFVTGARRAGIWFNGDPGDTSPGNNTVIGNFVTANGDTSTDAPGNEGIRIEEGANKNRLLRNVVTRNFSIGVHICGNDNRVRHNRMFNNDQDSDLPLDLCVDQDATGNVVNSNQVGNEDLNCTRECTSLNP